RHHRGTDGFDYAGWAISGIFTPPCLRHRLPDLRQVVTFADLIHRGPSIDLHDQGIGPSGKRKRRLGHGTAVGGERRYRKGLQQRVAGVEAPVGESGRVTSEPTRSAPTRIFATVTLSFSSVSET